MLAVLDGLVSVNDAGEVDFLLSGVVGTEGYDDVIPEVIGIEHGRGWCS